MIEFKSFPPQAKGDAIWSEGGKIMVSKLIVAHRDNSEKATWPVDVLAEAAALMVFDNVAGHDVRRSAAILNGLFEEVDEMGASAAMREEMHLAAGARLRIAAIPEGATA